MTKLLFAVVGAALMMTGVASATPLVAAASESTAVAGAAAGAKATAGGGGGGGGGSASTKEGDTIGGAIGFPASPSGPPCTNSYGVVWNFFWQVYDSPICVENDETNTVILLLNTIGNTPGTELTGAQLGMLNRVAMMSEKNCKALTSMKDLGGFVTCKLD